MRGSRWGLCMLMLLQALVSKQLFNALLDEHLIGASISELESPRTSWCKPGGLNWSLVGCSTHSHELSYGDPTRNSLLNHFNRPFWAVGGNWTRSKTSVKEPYEPQPHAWTVRATCHCSRNDMRQQVIDSRTLIGDMGVAWQQMHAEAGSRCV